MTERLVPRPRVLEVRPWVTRVVTRWIPVCRCSARRGPPGGVCANCLGAIPDAGELEGSTEPSRLATEEVRA